ncbi:LAFA_0E03246g1_1 [Lachancea sp. 'fantastica']|nr:LAFA_0E03246g1_1 [Lachancea sp. 'fantastica']
MLLQSVHLPLQSAASEFSLSVMSISDNDIWATDLEVSSSEFQRQETAEIRKLRSIHSKRGYVDGITSAKEDNLQEGFDSSYSVGSNLGTRIGVVLGELQILALLHGNNDNTLAANLQRAQQELRINKVLNVQHFDENCNPIHTNIPITRWEKILGDYQAKYKITPC